MSGLLRQNERPIKADVQSKRAQSHRVHVSQTRSCKLIRRLYVGPLSALSAPPPANSPRGSVCLEDHTLIRAHKSVHCCCHWWLLTQLSVINLFQPAGPDAGFWTFWRNWKQEHYVLNLSIRVEWSVKILTLPGHGSSYGGPAPSVASGPPWIHFPPNAAANLPDVFVLFFLSFLSVFIRTRWYLWNIVTSVHKCWLKAACIFCSIYNVWYWVCEVCLHVIN